MFQKRFFFHITKGNLRWLFGKLNKERLTVAVDGRWQINKWMTEWYFTKKKMRTKLYTSIELYFIFHNFIYKWINSYTAIQLVLLSTVNHFNVIRVFLFILVTGVCATWKKRNGINGWDDGGSSKTLYTDSSGKHFRLADTRHKFINFCNGITFTQTCIVLYMCIVEYFCMKHNNIDNIRANIPAAGEDTDYRQTLFQVLGRSLQWHF